MGHEQVAAQAAAEVDADQASNTVLQEGKMDPHLGRIVNDLIIHRGNYAVYLDQDNYTQWWYHGLGAEQLRIANAASNRVAKLEAIPVDVLSESVIRSFRRMVAEGLARSLDEFDDPASSDTIHKEAEEFIRQRLAEVARRWYLDTGLLGALICGVCSAAIGVAMLQNPAVTMQSWWHWLLIPTLGGLGASLSLLSRLTSLPADPVAGEKLHRLECLARITTGVVGAVVGVLAAKVGLLPQMFSTASVGVWAPLLAIVCGLSERIVPSLVAQVEKQATGGPPKV
jgi:uncharacterized membrane protein YeaQ/YmgE (transglycosylase-associated protein family)